MTSTRSPLTLLCDHVAQLSRTAQGDLALKRFADAGMEVDLADDLTVLLRRRGCGASRIQRAELVEFLVVMAPDDEVAALCAVVSLRPELEWMTRRSTRDPVGPDEAEADVVAVAWEVVTARHECRCGSLGHSALVNAIWSEVRRSAGLRRRVLLDIVPLPDDFERPAPEVDRLERWPGLLAVAVARGVLTPRQVTLIAQTRMEERPLSEVAVLLGRPYDAVRKERARAEAALREFALGYFTSEEE